MSEPNELEELGRVYGVEEHSHYGNVLRYAIEELVSLRVAASILLKMAPFAEFPWIIGECDLTDAEIAYLAAVTEETSEQ